MSFCYYSFVWLAFFFTFCICSIHEKYKTEWRVPVLLECEQKSTRFPSSTLFFFRLFIFSPHSSLPFCPSQNSSQTYFCSKSARFFFIQILCQRQRLGALVEKSLKTMDDRPKYETEKEVRLEKKRGKKDLTTPTSNLLKMSCFCRTVCIFPIVLLRLHSFILSSFSLPFLIHDFCSFVLKSDRNAHWL